MTILAVSKEDAINVCELGKGANCCIWLVIGSNGFECLYHERSTGLNLIGETLEEQWKGGKTVAKRDGCDRVRALNP